MLSIVGPAGKPCTCRLLDISLTGMRLELQAGDAIDLCAQATVRIQTEQAPLAGLLRGASASASIAWRDGILCGIALNTPIKMQFNELKQIIGKYQA